LEAPHPNSVERDSESIGSGEDFDVLCIVCNPNCPSYLNSHKQSFQINWFDSKSQLEDETMAQLDVLPVAIQASQATD